MTTITEQQMLSVAKLLEGAEEIAKDLNIAPPHTAAALAIATGSYAGCMQVELEEVLDVVARAYNGARQGAAALATGPAEEVPAELVEEPARTKPNRRKRS